eukprot:TRINITY_DN61634_c0_g1_i1.p2 TRINITY_DN61634_c0_g1~~TRINITY_DN61634_c0_g1_i1.p2  ORF type:complete len:138 (-),score=36.24 TRINITY_DN61634_c0_g1_i1:137-550(-)
MVRIMGEIVDLCCMHSRPRVFFFFFKQKTAYEMQRGLVGSEMCIRDSINAEYMGYRDRTFDTQHAMIKMKATLENIEEEEIEGPSVVVNNAQPLSTLKGGNEVQLVFPQNFEEIEEVNYSMDRSQIQIKILLSLIHI